MSRQRIVGLCALVVLGYCACASAFIARVDSGQAMVWQKATGAWVPIADSVDIAAGDSLGSDQAISATLRLSDGCALLVKGPCRLSRDGGDASAQFGLVQGEVLLRRDPALQPTEVQIIAKGCTFAPVGTVAAVKFTKAGEPTTAVLKGKMKMTGPDGNSVTVDAGGFGTLDANKTFKQGKIPANALTALEKWSGTKYEASVAEASPAPAQPAAASPAPAAATPAAAPAPAPTPAAEPAKVAEPATKPTDGGSAVASSGPEPSATPADTSKAAAAKDADKEKKDKAARDKPVWGLGAGPVTVGDETWTRICFSGDIPLWKFGIGLDVELFLNADGQFDSKGWEFTEDKWLETVFRKIRYLRFGHENEHLFVKFGGLEQVTLSHGLVMDRFTNMLHYPDQKLLGLQFYLNDLTKVGISLQTVIADFLDFKDDGGVIAGRLALKPLKATKIPIFKGLDIGVLGVTDLNQYAPARNWNFDLPISLKDTMALDHDLDNIMDGSSVQRMNQLIYGDTLTAGRRDSLIAEGKYDTLVQNKDYWAKKHKDPYSIGGLDMTLPLINGKVIGLDIYGQWAMILTKQAQGNRPGEKSKGWGIGAPGVEGRFGPAYARVEYRHTQGDFVPSFFGPYYTDERLRRIAIDSLNNKIVSKEQWIRDNGMKNLNGVYGQGGINIKKVLLVSATYQFLIGKKTVDSLDAPTDHRYEATLGVGELVISKIPKLKRVEAYYYKTNVLTYENPKKPGQYDKFFEPTPDTYYGYRLGLEVIKGAGLVWDARYTFEYNKKGKPIQKVSNVGIQASLTF